MPINSNIAMSYQAPNIQPQNALADYAAVQQIQGGQRQAEVADMQLAKMKRDEAALGQMMQTITAKGGPSDPLEAADAMIKSGIPHFMDTGFKLRQTHQQMLQDRATMGLPPIGAAAPAAAPTAAPSKAYPGYNESIGMTPSVNAMVPAAAAPVNAMAPNASDEAKRMQAKQMLLSPTPGVRALGEQMLKTLDTPPVYHTVPGVGLVDPRTGRVITASVETSPTDVKEYEYAKKEGFKGSLFDFKRQMAMAGRTPAQPTAPVAVVDPETGKSVFVSREQAISGKMAPATAQESLAPKEIQKREAALPQATAAVTGFEKKSDSFLKDLQALRDHPGLPSITGIAAGRLPGLTAEGRAAQALYDKVAAKGGFQMLQDLRDASKTGGALGNVSNQEGNQLKAAFGAIDRRQDVKDVQGALDTAIADVQGARARMRDAFEMTYAYKGGEAPTPRAPGAAPAANIDALLNKYK